MRATSPTARNTFGGAYPFGFYIKMPWTPGCAPTESNKRASRPEQEHQLNEQQDVHATPRVTPCSTTVSFSAVTDSAQDETFCPGSLCSAEMTEHAELPGSFAVPDCSAEMAIHSRQCTPHEKLGELVLQSDTSNGQRQPSNSEAHDCFNSPTPTPRQPSNTEAYEEVIQPEEVIQLQPEEVIQPEAYDYVNSPTPTPRKLSRPEDYDYFASPAPTPRKLSRPENYDYYTIKTGSFASVCAMTDGSSSFASECSFCEMYEDLTYTGDCDPSEEVLRIVSNQLH